MLTRQHKQTKEQVSILGFGCMRLPKEKAGSERIDRVRAQQMIDYAMAHDVTYYDTAYGYHEGDSEVFVGEAMKKYPRDTYTLATKMPIWLIETPEDVERIFNKQLSRTQTTYFDFYLLHALSGDSYEKACKIGIYELLVKKKEQGLIKHLGFSFHDTPEVLEKICSEHPWDFAQIQLNYLDWEMQNAKLQYEILERHNIPCIIMEPVRGGTLATLCERSNQIFLEARPNDSVASWALRYAASLPNVLTVLSGMSTMEQVADNVNTLSNFQPLTKQEYQVIDQAISAYKLNVTVPCTACRYCMDCPSGVDIPEMFKLYNEFAVSRDSNSYKGKYLATEQSARVEHCISCGKCVSLCPQSIQIPQELNRIQTELEKIL